MLKVIGIILVWIMLLTLVLAIGWYLFLKFHPVFGATTKTIISDKIQSSVNYGKEGFKNTSPTTLQWPNEVSNSEATEGFWTMLYKFFFDTSAQRIPLIQLPSIQFDADNLKPGMFSWLGHSTLIMNIDDTIVMTDPVFYKASPIPLGWSPFDFKHVPQISDLPDVDVVVISHDHYDHLDYQAITEIKSQVAMFLVPLWVRAHLLSWWVEEFRVVELDWYESRKVNEIVYTLTPAQHFSGRTLSRIPATLWWGWAIKASTQNIYISWDGWYFDGFKEIGEKYGPFDLAFIENWAYDASWKDVHMLPEQSVQAGVDVQADVVMPVHWWKFNLAFHSWNDPIERFLKAAKFQNFKTLHPIVWEIVDPETFESQVWWK